MCFIRNKGQLFRFKFQKQATNFLSFCSFFCGCKKEIKVLENDIGLCSFLWLYVIYVTVSINCCSKKRLEYNRRHLVSLM